MLLCFSEAFFTREHRCPGKYFAQSYANPTRTELLKPFRTDMYLLKQLTRDWECSLPRRSRIKCLPGRQSTKRTHSYSVFGSSPAHIVKSYRQRAVAVQKVVWHHEGEGSRNTKVGDEANEQRGHDANRNGSLWVFHFLTCDVEQTCRTKTVPIRV